MTDGPIIRDCQHENRKHEHGTRLGYVADGCRCEDCREAYNRMQRRWKKRLQMHGEVMVDAAPAREFLRVYMGDLRVPATAIGRAVGLSATAVSSLANGQKKVRRDSQNRLLRFTLDDLNPEDYVGARGAARRIQALAHLGYTPRDITRATGARTQNIVKKYDGKPADRIVYSRHKAIADFYEKHQNVPRETTTRDERGVATRVAREALKEGWAPPAAWDDIDLDPAPAKITRDSLAVDPGDVAHLLSAGYGPTIIRERLGISENKTILVSLERHGDEVLIQRFRKRWEDEIEVNRQAPFNKNNKETA